MDIIYSIKQFFSRFRKTENIDSNLIRHAIRELKLSGVYNSNKSDYDRQLADCVLELLRILHFQRHSGYSVKFVTDAFQKLSDFEPLTPLTGDGVEWTYCGNNMYQNNRCSRVFKTIDRFGGRPFDIYGKVFTDKDGSYTNGDSAVVIDFPYTPTTIYTKD